MKIYLVGGAVRDILMGSTPKDRDYVVVGATPEDMLNLEYTQVGCDFPVFLHPETKEEYALARTEVKNGNGYQGFNCHFGSDVTLEDDLARRDLTINAIAIDLETNGIIDPFNGQQDIKNKILRATTKAFREDPVRVLRLARFLSRFGPNWGVAPETTQLVLDIYDSGELKHLTPERVWKELEKALSEPYTQEFFRYLQDLDLFPEYDAGWDVPQREDYHPEGNVWIHQQLCIEKACDYKADKLTKFAVMVHDFGKSISYNKFMTLNGHEDAGVNIVKSFCQRLKIPNEYKDIGVLTAKYHTHIHNILELKPSTILRVFDETKALIKTDRFHKILLACKCDAQGRGEPFDTQDYPEEQIAKDLLEAVRLVDTKAISAKILSEGKEGLVIGNAIHQAKIKAIKDKMRELKNELSKR